MKYILSESPNPSLAIGDVVDCTYTMAPQSITLPPGKYQLEAWGPGSASKGKGGYSSGELSIDRELTIYVYVGGTDNYNIVYATNANGASIRVYAGGWNGGGTGGSKGGPGSTDFCMVYSDVTLDDAGRYVRTRESYASRFLVAGGSAQNNKIYTEYTYNSGGYVPGITLRTMSNYQGGMTSSGTYAASALPGFGYGGSYWNSGYGGAAGWYGSSATYEYGASSFAWCDQYETYVPDDYSVSEQYKLKNVVIKAGSSTDIPQPSGSISYGLTGNGYARITVLDILDPTKMTLPIPKELIYNGSMQYVEWENYIADSCTISGAKSAVRAGNYIAIFTPKEGYGWFDGTTEAKQITWTIERKALTKPSAQNIDSIEGFSDFYKPNLINFDKQLMSWFGEPQAMKPGPHTIGFKLKDKNNYKWEDGTDDDFTSEWNLTLKYFLTEVMTYKINEPKDMTEESLVPGIIFEAKGDGTSVDYWYEVARSIKLPAGRYKLQCWGSQGESDYSGYGGYSQGILTLSEPTILRVSPGARRYNGGGHYNEIGGGGAGTGTYNNVMYSTYSGGGSSDIRIGDIITNSSYYGPYVSNYGRIIVAGGGAGAPHLRNGNIDDVTLTASGGGITGICTASSSYRGTATSGYNFGAAQNANQNLSSSSSYYATGGAGGGWYGGKTYTSNSTSSSVRLYAGGGSGYVYTAATASQHPAYGKAMQPNTDYYLADAGTYAGNTEFEQQDGSIGMGNAGAGCVRITILSLDSIKTKPFYYKQNNLWKSGIGYVKYRGNWKNPLFVVGDNMIFPIPQLVDNKITADPFIFSHNKDYRNDPSISPEILYDDDVLINKEGGISAIEAGTYTITYSLNNVPDKTHTHMWVDHTIQNKRLRWTLSPCVIKNVYIPDFEYGSTPYIYFTIDEYGNLYYKKGNSYVYYTDTNTVVRYNANQYSWTADINDLFSSYLINNTAIGSYTLSLKIKYPNIVTFEDGSDTLEVPYSITSKQVSVPRQNGLRVYNGQAQTPVWETYNSSVISISDIVEQIEPGVYKGTATLINTQYTWLDGTTAPKEVTWAIAVPIPKVYNPSYDGHIISPYMEDFYEQYCYVVGETSGTEIGEYSISFGLKNVTYLWEDRTYDNQEQTWNIIEPTSISKRQTIYMDLGTGVGYEPFMVLSGNLTDAYVVNKNTHGDTMPGIGMNDTAFGVASTSRWIDTYMQFDMRIRTYEGSYDDNCCLHYYSICSEHAKNAIIPKNIECHALYDQIAIQDTYRLYSYYANSTNTYGDHSATYLAGNVYPSYQTLNRAVYLPELMDFLNMLPTQSDPYYGDYIYLKNDMKNLSFYGDLRTVKFLMRASTSTPSPAGYGGIDTEGYVRPNLGGRHVHPSFHIDLTQMSFVIK